jgi:hypothetical protein
MKKTLLSFLCIGATFVALAQTRPATDPNKTSSPSPTTTNSTLNNNPTNANAPINGTQTTPVNSGTGTVNGHNTMMNENRQYPGNNSMNNTPPSPTLNNGNTTTTPPVTSDVNGTTMDNGNTTTSATLGTTTTSAAYSVSVPASVQTSFTTAYPAAGTVTWSQSGDWYRARYRENGRLMESSYREDGKTFTRVASPVLRTYVPEDVVNKALDMYGVNVYAIGMTKNAEGQNMYNVTLIDNGQSRTEWMNEDGSAVASPYRTETDDASVNMNTEAQQTTTTETIPAEQVLDNTEPVDNSNLQDEMTDEPIEQREIIEQGTEQQQLEPGNQMNTEGINNGKSSEEMLNSQEESSEEISDEQPSYEKLEEVEVSPESTDDSPVVE